MRTGNNYTGARWAFASLRKPSGPLIFWLEQRGWTRLDVPPYALPECGAVGSGESGYCERRARWTKDHVQLCAQHAKAAEASE